MQQNENANSKIQSSEKYETKSQCSLSIKAIWPTGWAAGWVLPAKKDHRQSELRVADDSHPGPWGRSSSAHHLPSSFPFLVRWGKSLASLPGTTGYHPSLTGCHPSPNFTPRSRIAMTDAHRRPWGGVVREGIAWVEAINLCLLGEGRLD